MNGGDAFRLRLMLVGNDEGEENTVNEDALAEKVSTVVSVK